MKFSAPVGLVSLFCFAVTGLGNPLEKEALSRFIGAFEGDEVLLATAEIDSSRIAGIAQFEGVSGVSEIVGKLHEGEIRGEYTAGIKTFEFSLSEDSDGDYRLRTGEHELKLTKIRAVSFEGIWKNRDISVRLNRRSGHTSEFDGSVEISEKTYAAEGRQLGNYFVGSFSGEGESHDLRGFIKNDQWEMKSGGGVFPLSKFIPPPPPPPIPPTAQKAGELMTNTIGMRFRWCPSGESTLNAIKVKGFWIGQYEVTQAEYERIMGTNPSHFKESGKNAPVESVGWWDTKEFLSKLNEKEEREGKLKADWHYDLPTEIQWLYARRAGTNAKFSLPDDDGNFGVNYLDSTMANFDGNYPVRTKKKGPFLNATVAVGSYKGNAWGVHDMYGNVGEWCSDVLREEIPSKYWEFAIRGGYWGSTGNHFDTMDHAAWGGRERRRDTLGFRIVLVREPRG